MPGTSKGTPSNDFEWTFATRFGWRMLCGVLGSADPRAGEENGPDSKRSAALNLSNWTLSCKYVMHLSLLRTVCRGECPTRRDDVHSRLSMKRVRLCVLQHRLLRLNPSPGPR